MKKGESCENREILYVDPNKAESAREEAEEKIRERRKPAWGRVEERGSIVNTTVGKTARKKVQNRYHLMGSMDSGEWMCHGMQRKRQSEQSRKR